MKKIFCDCCGDEINRATDEALKHVNKEHVQWLVCHDRTNRQFSVKILIEPIRGNGEHIDLCGDCSWYLVDKTDPRPADERNQPRTPAKASTKY